MLIAEINGAEVGIPLGGKQPNRYGISQSAFYTEDAKKMYSKDGEVELTIYKPVNNGSVISGKFSFDVINYYVFPHPEIHITEGIFTNVQSKEW